MDSCCRPETKPVSKDRMPAMPPAMPVVPPMPQAAMDVLVLPPAKAEMSKDQQEVTASRQEALSPKRLATLMESILESQAGLRVAIQQLGEGLCSRLDDLDKSVASCKQIGQFQPLPFFLNVDEPEEEVKQRRASQAVDLEIQAKKWFQSQDKDKNGRLSKEELKALLSSWSMSNKRSMRTILNIRSEADIDRLLEIADIDHTGDFDIDEFVQMVKMRKEEVLTMIAEGSSDENFLLSNEATRILESPPASIVERIVTSVYFELATTVVVVINLVAMCTALQWKGLDHGSNLGLRDGDNSWVNSEARFDLIERLFNGIYLAELFLRICAYCQRCRMTIFEIADAIMIITSCLDTFVFQPMNVKILNVAVLRLLRLARLSRFFKFLRFSDTLSELRVMVSTLIAAIRGVVWTAALLCSIIAMGGIFMTQLANPFFDDEKLDLEIRQKLYENFGTVTRSMHSMFEATFTGRWPLFSRPLVEDVHYAFIFFWIVWIVVVNFVTMRVIGALFLSKTMKVGAADHEKCALNQLKRKGELSETLRMIFRSADTSGDGAISQDEFDEMLHSGTVIDEFEKMGLDVDQVKVFFSVLVADDGTADYNEFINGALAMATSSPAIDTMKSLQHAMKMDRDIQQILDSVEPLKKLFRTSAQRGSLLPGTSSTN